MWPTEATIAEAIALSERLGECVRQDVMKAPLPPHSAAETAHKATLGVMLKGTRIDSLVVGGPGFSCGGLERGDEVVMVGTEKVKGEEHLLGLLHGDDEPNTVVSMVIKRGDEAASRRVVLKRMASNMLTDRLRIFQIFTEMKERAEEDKDPIMTRHVDLCIAQWTRSLLDQAAHDTHVHRAVQRMQSQAQDLNGQVLSKLMRVGKGKGFNGDTPKQADKDAQELAAVGEKIDRLYRACMRATPHLNANGSSLEGGDGGGGLEDKLDAVLRHFKDWLREREDLARRLEASEEARRHAERDKEVMLNAREASGLREEVERHRTAKDAADEALLLLRGEHARLAADKATSDEGRLRALSDLNSSQSALHGATNELAQAKKMLSEAQKRQADSVREAVEREEERKRSLDALVSELEGARGAMNERGRECEALRARTDQAEAALEKVRQGGLDQVAQLKRDIEALERLCQQHISDKKSLEEEAQRLRDTTADSVSARNAARRMAVNAALRGREAFEAAFGEWESWGWGEEDGETGERNGDTSGGWGVSLSVVDRAEVGSGVVGESLVRGMEIEREKGGGEASRDRSLETTPRVVGSGGRGSWVTSELEKRLSEKNLLSGTEAQNRTPRTTNSRGTPASAVADRVKWAGFSPDKDPLNLEVSSIQASAVKTRGETVPVAALATSASLGGTPKGSGKGALWLEGGTAGKMMSTEELVGRSVGMPLRVAGDSMGLSLVGKKPNTGGGAGVRGATAEDDRDWEWELERSIESASEEGTKLAWRVRGLLGRMEREVMNSREKEARVELEIEALGGVFESLAEEKDNLGTSLVAAESERDGLLSDLCDTQSRVEALEGELGQRDDECAQLRYETNAFRVSAAAAEREVEGTKSDLEQRARELERATSQLRQRERELTSARERALGAEKEVLELRQRLLELEKASETNVEVTRILQTEKDRFQGMVRGLEGEIAGLKNCLQEELAGRGGLEGELKKAMDELGVTAAEYAEAVGALRSARGEFENMKEERDALLAALDSAKTDLHELAKTVERLSAEAASSRSREGVIGNLEAKVREIEEELERERSEVAREAGRADAMENAYRESEDRCDHLSRERDAHQRGVTRVESEKEAVLRNLNRMERRALEVEEDLSSLQGEFEEHRSRVNSRLGAYDVAAAEARSTIDKVRSDLAMALNREREAKEAGDRIADKLTQKLQEFHQEREGWDTTHQAAKQAGNAAVEAKDMELERLTREIETKTRDSHARQREVERLEKIIEQSSQRAKEYSQTLSDRDGQIAAMMRDLKQTKDKLVAAEGRAESAEGGLRGATDRVRSFEAALKGSQTQAEKAKERHLAKCRATVQRMLKIHLIKAFENFLIAIRKHRDAKQTVKKLVGRMRNGALAVAFDCFLDGVDFVKEHKDKVKQTLGHWANRPLALAFDGWLHGIELQRAEAQHDGFHLAQREIEGQINTLKTDAEKAKERYLAKCRDTVKRMLQVHLVKAFESFVVAVRKHQEAKETVKRLIGRMQNGALAAGFERFAEGVESVKQQKERVQHTLGRWKNRPLAMAFEMWLDGIAAQRQEVAHDGLHLAQRELAGQLEGLKSDAERVKERHLEKCRATVKRMLQYQLVHAFESFVLACERHREAQETVKRLIGRMQNGKLAAAFERFAEGVESVKEQKERVQHTLGRWKNRPLAMAFEMWLDGIAAQRQEAQDEGLHLAQRELAGQLEGLKSDAERVKERHLEKCRATVKRMLQYQLVHAFESFVLACERHREAQETVKMLIGRMQNGKLAAAFERFAEGVESVKEQKERVQHTLGRWKNRPLAIAFDGWQDGVAAQRGEIEEEGRELAKKEMEDKMLDMMTDAERARERHLAKCRETVRRMLRIQVVRALHGFYEAVQKHKKAQETVRRLIGRMQNGKLAAAFERFAEGVESVKEQKERVQHTLGRWKNRPLAMAFEMWLDGIAAQRQEAQDEGFALAQRQIENSKTDAEKARERYIAKCRATVKRMLQYQLVHAFESFVLACERHREAQETVKRLIGRMQNGKLAAAFERFAEGVESVKEQKERVQHTLGRWKNRPLAMAFEMWLDGIAAQREEAKDQGFHLAQRELASQLDGMKSDAERAKERHLEKCRATVRRMLQYQLVHAFESFVLACERHREAQETVKRLIGRMQNGKLAAAFERFAEGVESAKQDRLKVQRTIGKWKNQPLAMAFEMWIDGIAAQRVEAEREGMEQARDQLQNEMRELMSDAEAAKQRHLAKCRDTVKRMMQVQLARAWEGFINAVNRHLEAKETVRKLVNRMKNGQMANAFERFCDGVETFKEEKERVRQTIGRWKNQGLSMAFEAWQDGIIAQRTEALEEGFELARRELEETTLTWEMEREEWGREKANYEYSKLQLEESLFELKELQEAYDTLKKHCVGLEASFAHRTERLKQLEADRAAINAKWEKACEQLAEMQGSNRSSPTRAVLESTRVTTTTLSRVSQSPAGAKSRSPITPVSPSSADKKSPPSRSPVLEEKSRDRAAMARKFPEVKKERTPISKGSSDDSD